MSLDIRTVTYFPKTDTLEVEGSMFFRNCDKSFNFFTMVVSDQIYDIYIDTNKMVYEAIPLNMRTLEHKKESIVKGNLWVKY